MASPTRTINTAHVAIGRAVAAGGTLDDTTLIINVFELSARITVRPKPWGALSETRALPHPELRLHRLTDGGRRHLALVEVKHELPYHFADVHQFLEDHLLDLASRLLDELAVDLGLLGLLLFLLDQLALFAGRLSSVGATGANLFRFFLRPVPLTFGIGRPVERTKGRFKTRICAVHDDMGRGCTAPATGRAQNSQRGRVGPQERIELHVSKVPCTTSELDIGKREY